MKCCGTDYLSNWLEEEVKKWMTAGETDKTENNKESVLTSMT